MAKVSAPPKPVSPAGEASLDARTLGYLKTLVLEALLDATEPQRITDLSRSVIDLLGLDLSEDEAGRARLRLTGASGHDYDPPRILAAYFADRTQGSVAIGAPPERIQSRHRRHAR